MVRVVKFMTGYQRGLYKKEELDNHIIRWQDDSTEESLPSYLGMTFDEYTAWVEGEVEVDDLIKRRDKLKTMYTHSSLFVRVVSWLLRKLRIS